MPTPKTHVSKYAGAGVNQVSIPQSAELLPVLAFAYATGRQDAEIDLSMRDHFHNIGHLPSALEFSKRVIKGQISIAHFPELWSSMVQEGK